MQQLSISNIIRNILLRLWSSIHSYTHKIIFLNLRLRNRWKCYTTYLTTNSIWLRVLNWLIITNNFFRILLKFWWPWCNNMLILLSCMRWYDKFLNFGPDLGLRLLGKTSMWLIKLSICLELCFRAIVLRCSCRWWRLRLGFLCFRCFIKIQFLIWSVNIFNLRILCWFRLLFR